MRKAILISGVIILFCSASFAQTKNDTIQQLQNRVLKLEVLNSGLSKQVKTANSKISTLEKKLSAAADSLDLIKKELVLTNKNLKEIESNLALQIREVSNKTNSDLSALNSKVHRNTLIVIAAVIFTVFLTLFIFVWLKNKFTGEKMILSDKIKSTSEALREELMNPDKLLFLLAESQIQLRGEDEKGPDEIDHSLALKVADEIVRIQKYLSTMDPETRGVKKLAFAVERIQDNFNENGYEMVDLLHKPYDEGMKLSAKFIPDKSLSPGEKIITRIIKPMVNYKGVTIQPAEVEVSTGE